jgi:HSP90 family molecular chaperone
MSITTHKIKARSHILTLLGDELIGSDSLAIFELVKNSYDADAENVSITFVDLNTPNQKIIIEDDGHGMDSKVIQDVWLTIGTDFKRGKNRKESKKLKRVSFGNKGVGRLAVHKLAREIILETQLQGDLFSNRLKIDWKTLIESKEYIQELEVEVENVSDILFMNGHGTRIILSKLTTTNWSMKTLKDLVRKINNIKSCHTTSTQVFWCKLIHSINYR